MAITEQLPNVLLTIYHESMSADNESHYKDCYDNSSFVLAFKF